MTSSGRRPILVSGRGWYVVAVLSALTVAVAGFVAAQRTAAPVALGIGGGVVVGLLAVLALPSLPTRLATVGVLGMSGLLVAHHVGASTTSGPLVLVWAGLLVVTLVAVEHAHHGSFARLDGRPNDAPGRWGREVLVPALAVATVAAAAAVVLAPVAQRAIRPAAVAGSQPTQRGFEDGPASLRSTSSLDMTTSPRLGDGVVLRIDADRPDFWRGETFDLWDGARWTRTRPEVFGTRRDGDGSAITVEQHALPIGGSELTQVVRVEVEYAELVLGAPTILRVEADRALAQRSDGTAVPLVPFGKGSVYTVTSARAPATEESLRDAPPAAMPSAIRDQYATPTVITDRVAQLAQAVTADAPTTYDKVRAIERWLAANVEYSIDAPISPAGVDVVDHFLFESRVGWCQQTSTSLAVMLRHLGIPARVAVGFVPGDYDSLAGEYVVRERDAHQWVEVYFPGIGWQGFDPTASVPLAAEAEAPTSASRWLVDHLVLIAVGALALAGCALGLHLARRALATRRAVAARTWSAQRLAELEALGAGHGQPRASYETAREYAGRLAGLLGDERLVRVGAGIDADAFSERGLGVDEREQVSRALGELIEDSTSRS